MKIAVASDGRGDSLRRAVLDGLTAQGHEVADRGVNRAGGLEAALDTANTILTGVVERAILVSSSAFRASLIANRIDGIRAGLGFDAYDVRRGAENGLNLVCLSVDLKPSDAVEIVSAFVGARSLVDATLRGEPARAVVAA